MQVRPLSVLGHPDFSEYVVHFTERDGGSLAPFAVQQLPPSEKFASILTGRIIQSFPVFGFSDPAVCLSECTARGVQHLIAGGRYGPFGVAFRKQFIFDVGGSPALYVRGDQWCAVRDWPIDLRAKAVRYWPGAVGESLPRHLEARSEWLGEREWRVVPSTGALAFDYSDVAFVIVSAPDWLDQLACRLGGEQGVAVRSLPRVVINAEGTVIERWPSDLNAFAAIEDEVMPDSADDLFDTDWRRETMLDARSQEQATRLLDALDSEELARRSDPDLIASRRRSLRPKDALETPEPDLCPVCGTKALEVEGFDQFGGNIGPGTCTVCGYYRSPFIADQEAISEHVDWLMGDGT